MCVIEMQYIKSFLFADDLNFEGTLHEVPCEIIDKVALEEESDGKGSEDYPFAYRLNAPVAKLHLIG